LRNGFGNQHTCDDFPKLHCEKIRELQQDFWRRGAPGRQKSRCNLLQNSASCSKIPGGPARLAGPPEISLQLVAKISELQQDFWPPGAARWAVRNLAATF